MAKLKSLMPYFILALLIIAAYRISGEMRAFANFFGWVWRVISPFFYGFLLAYVINMPCGSIQRLLVKTNINVIVKRRRIISLIIVILILLFLVFLALNLVIPPVRNSIIFLSDAVPIYLEQLINSINNLGFFELDVSSEDIFALAGTFFSDLTFETLIAPIEAIMNAANAVFRAAIAFIASIYIMIEKERSKLYINRLLRIFTTVKFREMVFEIFGGLNTNLRRYIHTQTIGGVILGAMSSTALLIMRSPHALVLGILIWIANYIPYFGSIFAVIVSVLVVTITQGWTMGLISLGVLLVIQQIEVNIIQPKLMSDAFSMSPLLVIISISIGGAIGGILGMMVIIPIVAVLKDILDRIVIYHEQRKFGVYHTLESDDEA